MSSLTRLLRTGSKVRVVGWLDAVAQLMAGLRTETNRWPSQYDTVIEAGSADSIAKETVGERELRDSPRGLVADGEKAEPASAPTVPAATRQGGTTEHAPVAPVIPLIHAPDDPGPEASEEPEPRAEAQAGAWRKMFE